MRTALVVIHASAGLGGLVTGLAALSPPRPIDNRRWLRRLYLACIAILLASMVALVTIDWNGVDTGARAGFAALSALGGVMVYRLARAHREASRGEANWQERYIGHVYFTYISLWEGFVILPALNLPFPQLSVPLVAVAVLLIGHALLARHNARILAAQPVTVPGGSHTGLRP
jgi:peptidoglycan/LPS O-acetylase OafA/YrhL